MSRGDHLSRIPDTIAPALAERLTRRGEAIAVGNRAGVIEWTNAAWTRVTGWALERVVDKPVAALLDQVGLERSVLDFVRGHFVAGRGCALELAIEGADGCPRSVHLEVEPLSDEGGDVAHFVAIATDVTERRLTERAVERPADPDADARVAHLSRDGPRSATLDAFAADALGALREVARLCDEIERTTALGLLDELGVRAVYERSSAAGDRARDLLERAARGAPALARVDACDVARRAVERATVDLPPRVQLDVVLDDALPGACAADDVLADGLVALIGIGIEAIDDSWGTLSLTTGVTVPGRVLRSSVHFPDFVGTLHDDAPRSFIEVHDTGTALSADEVRRVRGGVLPTPASLRVAALVEACARLRGAGAEVDVAATPGYGTRVLLRLPVDEG